MKTLIVVFILLFNSQHDYIYTLILQSNEEGLFQYCRKDWVQESMQKKQKLRMATDIFSEI